VCISHECMITDDLERAGEGEGGRGGGSGSQRLVCRHRAAGRFSAPRGATLLLFTTSIFKDITRACGQEGPRGIGSGCEIHSDMHLPPYSARERHNTNCIKKKYKTSARLLPVESPARGCSGSRFFCAPGPAVQGRSSRASSPARPSLDLDHALPISGLSMLVLVCKCVYLCL
jgi:hypothetical protein